VPRETFRPAVLEAGDVVWSDDIQGDPRFAFDLFRAVPHRSGVVIPILVEGELAGTVYLLWWEAAHRVVPTEAAMLQAIGRQVGLLVRNARLIEEAELRRRVAEAAKQHYRRLFDRNLAGVFRVTLSGRMIECNEAFARLLGHRTPADAVRDDAWAVCADTAERDRLLTSLGRERRVTNYEARWRRVNGAEFTVMMNAIRIGDGDEALIEGIVLDVTERTQAEEALREREAQLRALGNNLPDGVIYQVVRRPDGSNYFPYMSSGLEGMFGVTAEEAMRDASVVYRLVLPEDLERIRDAADESIRTGHPFDVEYRLRTADGGERWFNLRARPSPLDDGATRWDAVALDMTHRRRAEEALREREARLAALTEGLRRSEARYRLLFERSFVGIFRSRSDGTVVDCNDAFARLLGYRSAAEARGRSAVDHWATPAERDLVVARIAAGQEVVDTEVLGRRVDGTLFAMSLSMRRLDEEDGPVHEGVVLDLTDRKNAEAAIALRSVADLARAAAEEIDDPLTTLLARLAAIENGESSAEGFDRTRAAVLRIRDVMRHLARTIRLG
jgi:PAS domain S-box-containing protein